MSIRLFGGILYGVMFVKRYSICFNIWRMWMPHPSCIRHLLCILPSFFATTIPYCSVTMSVYPYHGASSQADDCSHPPPMMHCAYPCGDMPSRHQIPLTHISADLCHRDFIVHGTLVLLPRGSWQKNDLILRPFIKKLLTFNTSVNTLSYACQYSLKWTASGATSDKKISVLWLNYAAHWKIAYLICH